MGQAPATDQISLRTVPRNFPGRSGTREDKVYLVSPETAAASALRGVITDPRTLDIPYPQVHEPETPVVYEDMLCPPLPPDKARQITLHKGPNIVSLPEFEALPDKLDLPLLLKVGDDISTDEIMPAGARILPFRSNIPEISAFCFEIVDDTYAQRARDVRDEGGHVIIGGDNYGQGSSREHAALAPRYLGLRVVIAKSFARIHWQNLVNFGVLPLTFLDAHSYEQLEPGRRLALRDLKHQLQDGKRVTVRYADQTASTESEESFETEQQLSRRQLDVVLAGGLINWVKKQASSKTSDRTDG